MSYDLYVGIDNQVFTKEKYWRFIDSVKLETNLKSAVKDIFDDEYEILPSVHLFNDWFENDAEPYISIWMGVFKSSTCVDSYLDYDKYQQVLGIETGMYRSNAALAFQYIIPVMAFRFFEKIIFVDESNKKCLHEVAEYKQFVKNEITSNFNGLNSFYASLVISQFDMI
jgi:hypothetical protein